MSLIVGAVLVAQATQLMTGTCDRLFLPLPSVIVLFDDRLGTPREGCRQSGRQGHLESTSQLRGAAGESFLVWIVKVAL